MLAVSVSGCAQYVSGAQWAMGGQDVSNSRNQPSEATISAANVSTLAPKWVFTAGGSVSATPTVAADGIYFPDWAGNLYAVDPGSGKPIWSAKISDYDGVAGSVARVSPVISGSQLILGDNQGDLGPHKGANLMAVDRKTGKLLWITQIDAHPAAIVTGSAVVYNNVIYQGVSSSEEQYATNAQYPCCTFRGSVVAVSASTGKVLWQTFDMPANNGATDQYSGGAIWQPPVVDASRGMLYVGTGNNYTAPVSVMACQADNLSATDCTADEDYFDAVLGLDLATGAVRWTRKLEGYDVWTVACVGNPGNPCPSPAGPDYDLGGSGGNLVGGLVGFGQKSGIYWALNTVNGSLLWGTSVGPGGNLGGIQWGTATDGDRIYVADANNEYVSFKGPAGQTITGGSWAALDAATGKILWQTADPTPGAFDSGAVSVANGVLYAGSLDGHMYALDASTGKILWSFASGGTVMDGAAIASGVVYWGSGYNRSGGTANNKVYAFTLGGK